MTSPDRLPIGHYGPGSTPVGEWEWPDLDLVALGDEVLFGPIRQLLSAVTGLPLETWPTVPEIIEAASDLLSQIGAGIESLLSGVIPLGWLSATTPNMLINGGFDGAVSMTPGEGWSYDETVGRTKPGAALFTAAGIRGVQVSEPVQVADGQKLDAEVWVKWSGVATSASTAAWKLAIRWWDGETMLAETVLDTQTSPTTAGGWVKFDGTATTPAGADLATLTLSVEDVVTAGSIWWDDAALRKPATSIPQQWVTGLLDALGNLGDWIEHLIDQALTALGIPTVGEIGDRIGDFADAIGDLLGLGEDNAAGLDTLIDKLLHDPAAVLGSIPQTLVSGLSSALSSVEGYVQDLVNAILRAIRGIPVVGGSLADIITEIGGLKSTADTAQSTATQVQTGIVEGWAGGSSTGADPDVFDTMAAIKSLVGGDGYTRVNVTSTQTWTKPTGTTEVIVVGIAAGQDGANGGRSGTEGAAPGGAGGAGGGHLVQALDVGGFSAIHVTVGTSGSPTTFRANTSGGGILAQAVAGSPGGMATQFGYTGSASSAGNGGTGAVNSFVAGLPGAASNGAAGGSAGASQSAGGPGGSLTAGMAVPCGGGGGGGGGGSKGGVTGNAGNGGPGGFPGGGGGGGGSSSNGILANPGSGGSGAAGLGIIYYR